MLIELLVKVEPRLENVQHLVRALLWIANLKTTVGQRHTRQSHQPPCVERHLDHPSEVAVTLAAAASGIWAHVAAPLVSQLAATSRGPDAYAGATSSHAK